MKLRLTALLALAAALAPFSGKALDLTPVPAFRDLEGVQIPVVHFTDAGKKSPFNLRPNGP